jgi:DNA-binding MarR family transcriptional regulator
MRGDLTMKEYAADFPKQVYEQLAEFRYKIRKHIRVSESAARRAGITPKQYQLMLAIKGYPGRDFATPTELAEQLQITRHACVELIQRCESTGLVSKLENKRDARSVVVSISSRGLKILNKITALHLAQSKDSDIFSLEQMPLPGNQEESNMQQSE